MEYSSTYLHHRHPPEHNSEPQASMLSRQSHEGPTNGSFSFLDPDWLSDAKQPTAESPAAAVKRKNEEQTDQKDRESAEKATGIT
jgi:hypothetical protein